MGSAVTVCDAQKEYSISTYEVHLGVQRSGAYHVRERIGFNFQSGSFSSANRSIPLEDIDTLRNIRVSSSQTVIDSLVRSREDDTQHIRWYYPERATPTTFTIEYEVVGALYEDNGRNIVDWNAIGSSWSVPIDSVRAAIVLPGSFASGRDSISLEPEDEGTIMRVGNRWLVAFNHAQLPPETGYRVIVSFPKQLEGRPRGGIAVWKVIAGFGAMCLGLIPGIILFRRWKGPRRRISPTSEPPELSLLEAAYISGAQMTEQQRAC